MSGRKNPSDTSHAVAFRTVDVTVSPQGGGKLGMYSYWPLTDPVTAVSAMTRHTSPQTQPGVSAGSYTPQYEFYNHTAGNAAETGNSYTTDPAAPTFAAAFGGIVNNELYNLFSTTGAPSGLLYSQCNLALTAFSIYLSNTASAGLSFPVSED